MALKNEKGGSQSLEQPFPPITEQPYRTLEGLFDASLKDFTVTKKYDKDLEA